jgi:hypothetical protein
MEQISHLYKTYFTHHSYMLRQPPRGHHRAVHRIIKMKVINFLNNSVMDKHMLCI